MKRIIELALVLLSLAGASWARTISETLRDTVLSKKADSSKAGYLAAYWKTSETGVFFALSSNDDPLSFTELNGGKPIFIPTLGTKVIRDVSIVSGGGDELDSKWYIIGTDLDISSVSTVGR